MTFEQFWTIMIKQWKLVLICFLCIGMGAFIGSKLIKPLYQSSSLVRVAIRSGTNNQQADINNLMASDQLVQTEATLAASTPVLVEVASHYPRLTVSQLSGEVSTLPRINTQLFEIDVVDGSPSRATLLANDIAITLIAQQQRAIQQDNIQAQAQIQQNIDLTSQQINSTTAKISALQAKGGNGNKGQIALLQVQLSGLQQHYSQWQTALAQLELAQVQSGNLLQLVQPAQTATSPVQPNIRLNTLGGLLIGLLLGILLAVLYERLNTRVRAPGEISQLLEWPALATIWRVNVTAATPGAIINPANPDINIEPYRILRTNIGFSSIDNPLRSLVVVSAFPGEGKSVIAANLAIYMAKAGKNTLLIDADFHRPTQRRLFNLTPDKLGLSNAVLALSMSGSGPSSAPFNRQFVQPNTLGAKQSAPTTLPPSLSPYAHTVGIPNLWIMPTGPMPPNPPEWFESKVMQRFLAMLSNCGVEMVIFDTPPLLSLSDASILASKVDGALVVVDTTRATKGKLRQMKTTLTQTGVHVLGCVANKVQRKRSDQTYYNDYAIEQQSDVEQSASAARIPPALHSPPPVETSTSSVPQFHSTSGW